jgi:hypothetical protein
MKLLGTVIVYFDVTDQLLIRFSAFFRYWEMIGIDCDITSAIQKFQEILWFSDEEIIVQYSYRVWNPHESSQA